MIADAYPDADLRPIIAGRPTDPRSDRLLVLTDPATGRETARYAGSGQATVDQAVAAARSAFTGDWGLMGPGERMAILHRFADLVDREGDAIARADRIDVGKPISAARAEAGVAAGFIRYYAQAIDKAQRGIVAPTGIAATELQLRRPRGVIGMIVPWNYPVINLALKIAPALAAGNSVVAKPSEISPRSALILARLGAEAGLPAGTLSVLPGDGATGEAIAVHGDIDMISFTGSTATGRAIMRGIGQSTLKPILLECGGKSPELLFDDMAGQDLDAIAAHIVAGAYANQGQLCVARTRLYIEDGLYEPLLDRVLAHAGALKAGDPDDPATTYGPLASDKQRATVERYIVDGIEAGAEMLLDGRRSTTGCFLEPTVFAVRGCDIALTREEIFGPVLAVSRFRGEAEAIALANATAYALAATIWTRDIGRAHRMARSVTAGTVKICSTPDPREGAGFAHAAEPARQSGFGIEGGLAALDSYSRLQSVEFRY
jgi:gamma-glutamyl-gamma-aminobutyraldehyde dehydrogenase